MVNNGSRTCLIIKKKLYTRGVCTYLVAFVNKRGQSSKGMSFKTLKKSLGSNWTFFIRTELWMLHHKTTSIYFSKRTTIKHRGSCVVEFEEFKLWELIWNPYKSRNLFVINEKSFLLA